MKNSTWLIATSVTRIRNTGMGPGIFVTSWGNIYTTNWYKAPYLFTWKKKFRQKLASHLHCFREDQAAIAAFFSACFLFLAGSPVNIIPANSTVPVNTGRCPRPDLNVKYCGNGAPTLCAISCRRFLYTPVSS